MNTAPNGRQRATALEPRGHGENRVSLRLQPNVQFLYEVELAYIEMGALGCHDFAWRADNLRNVGARLSGDLQELHRRTAYVGEIDGRPTPYSQLIRPKYQGGEYNRTRSVNQYLTHWVYPYRGKFHPQMTRALLNIVGARPGTRVMDPYVGSGTTALEAMLLGVDFVGIDLSPLCILLATMKTQSHGVVSEIKSVVEELLRSENVDLSEDGAIQHNNQIVANFLTVARMVTLSDVARRGRDIASAFRRNLNAMLESTLALARAVDVFGINPGRVEVRRGDVRDLASAGIASETVDGVVTSPPYSIALDYVKNDQHALDALGVDIQELRGVMTGVRGRGAKERLSLYNEDMRRMFREVARVLKPGARAAFVIGDATIGGREVTTTGSMVKWAEANGLILDRELDKIVFGLYNVMQQEKILVFRKGG